MDLHFAKGNGFGIEHDGELKRKVKHSDYPKDVLDNYYTYIHRTLDGTPFYVGAGHNLRYIQTISRSEKWFDIFNSNDYIISELIDINLTREESFICEIALIKKYGRLDKLKGTLVNITDGGEGTKGADNPGFNKKLYGIDNPNFGNKYAKNSLSKAIIRFTLDGTILDEFGSISQAENKLKIASANISSCCTKARHTAGGYIFRFKEDYNINGLTITKGKTSKKKIAQVDINRRIVNTFESAYEAELYGFTSKVVSKLCKCTGKTYKGFRWYFYDDIKDRIVDGYLIRKVKQDIV